MLQLLLGGTSHGAQSDSRPGVPSVAPAIERVYRNSEHLRQICDRAEAELATATANLLKIWRSRS